MLGRSPISAMSERLAFHARLRSITALRSPRGMRNAFWVAGLVAVGLGTAPAMAQGVVGAYTPGISLPGFYVRGMAGGAFGTGFTFKDVNPNDPNAVLGPGTELNGDSNTSAIFGGGIGYRFSPIFWADVTAEGISNLGFKNGNTTSANAFTPLQGMTAKIDTFMVMANGYVDVLRAFRLPAGALQPYIMGSLGYSHNHMGAMSGTVPGFGPVTFASGTHDDFAWGIGAGVGIPITANIALDLGYEYLDLGEVRSGTSGTLTTGGVPITAAAGPMKAGLQTHTFQVGFRLGF